MAPSIPHPVAAQVYAGEWFDSFNNLVDQARTLAFSVLGLVVVLGVLTALHVSKGAIVKVVMAGLTGAVAIWLATHAQENADRTDTELTGGTETNGTQTNGAPASLLVPGQPGWPVPVTFARDHATSGASASWLVPSRSDWPDGTLTRAAGTGGVSAFVLGAAVPGEVVRIALAGAYAGVPAVPHEITVVRVGS